MVTTAQSSNLVPPWFYPYPTLYEGRLLKRYKRFMADIELGSGEIITAHCPNTGPMTGVCQVGHRVMVSKSDNPKRKLAYTWELIEADDNGPTWVGVNTALPNRVVQSVLDAHLIPELGPYTTIRAEVPYGKNKKSRIDFLLSTPTDGDAGPYLQSSHATAHKNAGPKALSVESPEHSEQPLENRSIYVEVKNTTWVDKTLALFPDTVTTRGQKHLKELMDVVPEARAVMLYFINRGDCLDFAPGDRADPVYGELLREAIATGVEVLPCRFNITPDGIRYQGLANLVL